MFTFTTSYSGTMTTTEYAKINTDERRYWIPTPLIYACWSKSNRHVLDGDGPREPLDFNQPVRPVSRIARWVQQVQRIV